MKSTVVILNTDEAYSLNVELDQRVAHWCRPDTDMATMIRMMEE